MASNTPPVRVSECVDFGGSLTVDLSQHPKNVSNITLMTFNCSTGNFSSFAAIGVTSNDFCGPELQYLPNALVLTLSDDDCNNKKEGSSPSLWIYSSVAIVIPAAIVVGLVRHFTNPKKSVEARVEELVAGSQYNRFQ